jgi:hypothetical protein
MRYEVVYELATVLEQGARGYLQGLKLVTSDKVVIVDLPVWFTVDW